MKCSPKNPPGLLNMALPVYEPASSVCLIKLSDINFIRLSSREGYFVNCVLFRISPPLPDPASSMRRSTNCSVSRKQNSCMQAVWDGQKNAT